MITLEDISENLIGASYAVRGPIVDLALDTEKKLRKGDPDAKDLADMLDKHGMPKELIYCNIGNPLSFNDQHPLTYVRQVLSLVINPVLISQLHGLGIYPEDIFGRAQEILGKDKNIGTYTASAGLAFARQAAADFITGRDNIPSDPESIFMTDGASEGIMKILQAVITGKETGIMTPIPQYPLYSGAITLFGGTGIGYQLDESKGWALSLESLEESLKTAEAGGTKVKAIVVINPGNPTGSILSRENIESIIDFAKKHNVAILADEVYQANIYDSEKPFISFAKVLHEKGQEYGDVSLFSFHSASKGLSGECGLRAGYVEIRNVGQGVIEQLTKLKSLSLCSNHVGQIAEYLLLNPPKEGDPSYDLYNSEIASLLQSYKQRADILFNGLNQNNISCVRPKAAMYAYPKLNLPEGMTDGMFCERLVKEYGLVTVPGTGFGMPDHLRMTILPSGKQLDYSVWAINDLRKKI